MESFQILLTYSKVLGDAQISSGIIQDALICRMMIWGSFAGLSDDIASNCRSLLTMDFFFFLVSFEQAD